MRHIARYRGTLSAKLKLDIIYLKAFRLSIQKYDLLLFRNIWGFFLKCNKTKFFN